jgi:hypothetical protein
MPDQNRISAVLSPDEHRELPKLGPKTLGFDELCAGHMAARPTLRAQTHHNSALKFVDGQFARRHIWWIEEA